MQLRDQREDICWPNHWSVLGGGVEAGESFEQAVMREIREESGLEMTGLVAIGEVVDIEGSGRLLRVFEGCFDGDTSELTLGEGQRLEFVPPEVWDRILIPPFIRGILEGTTIR